LIIQDQSLYLSSFGVGMKTASDIMTRKVVSVNSETPLLEAVKILEQQGFNGLPVLDQDNKVVGIITEYDMIIKGSSVHLPTFMKLFQEMDLYRKDTGLIRDDLRKIFSLKVKNVMNREPLTLTDETPLPDIDKTFNEHHRVNPIPIVNKENRLVGIISRSDMLKFFGGASLNLKENMTQEDIDKNIKLFLNNFENNFTLVGTFRTRWWLVASISFLLVGFAIAWLLILRINF